MAELIGRFACLAVVALGLVAALAHAEPVPTISLPTAPSNTASLTAAPPVAAEGATTSAPLPSGTAVPPPVPSAAPLPSATAVPPPAPSTASAPSPPAPVTALGPAAKSPPACACKAEPETPTRISRVEFSFGSAELFTNQSVTDPAGIIRQRVVPITALGIFGEYLWHPRLAVIAQFLLPLEPDTALIDGELTLEYVPPAVSGGLRVSAASGLVMDDTALEGQVFLLGGSTLGSLSGDAFYPTLGWRAHLRDENGFAMYVGTSFAFRRNTTGLIYGVGHRF